MLDFISSLSPLAGLITGRRGRGMLWWYLWVCFCCDVAGYLENYFRLPRAHANVFLVLEFLLVSAYLLQRTLRAGRIRQAAAITVCLIALAFCLRCLAGGLSKPDYAGGAIFYSLYILLCVWSLYRVTQEVTYLRLEHSALFMFAAPFLLYASGVLMMLLFKIFLTQKDMALMNHIWDVHNVLNILKNAGIAHLFSIPSNKKIAA